MPKILIVDDDTAITELMDLLLKMEGYQTTIINDSLQAMDAAKTTKPDLITLDLMMPHLTGFELCEMLRKDPEFSDTPIIIISARDDAQSKDSARKVGASDYITKPFNTVIFLDTIKSLTGK